MAPRTDKNINSNNMCHHLAEEEEDESSEKLEDDGKQQDSDCIASHSLATAATTTADDHDEKKEESPSSVEQQEAPASASSPPPARPPAPLRKKSSYLQQQRCYTRHDLEPFNLLDHPVWVFDAENKSMWWANLSALSLWSADSLDSLLARDFTDMSEAVERRCLENLAICAKGKRISESWTFYPNGQGPTTCYITMSGMYVEQGRVVVLVEGELMKVQQSIDESALRAVEMLRHLPIPVGQFDAQGRVMDQNPESINVFGGCKEASELQASHEAAAAAASQVASSSSSSDSTTTSTTGTSSDTSAENDDSDNNDHQESSNNTVPAEETTQSILLERFVDKELGKRVLHQVVEEGIDYNDEVQQHTKRGIRWFAIKMRRSKDPVNGARVILYSARDITALIEAKNSMIICANAKKEADQANMAKSEFVAVMAHEIRTPLHQVLGFLELMAQTTNLTVQQQEYVNLMEHAASCLMTVINDLLDFTKLEAGKMKMERISLSIQTLATGLLEIMTPKAEEKGVSITSCFDDRIPPLLGDPNRIRQLLLNLLQNAVKFTSVGTISLHITRLSDDDAGRVLLKFVVADTGIGIHPDQHQNIFNKYQQANSSISRNYGGTGLGLAICKIIVETLGGTIGVDSVVGQGSKFWFQIPFDKAVTGTLTPVSSCTNLAAGKLPVLYVLVAEDNKVSQKLVVSVLTRLGHKSMVVENGIQAVEAVQRNQFDLVLMDVQMPEMDGIEATQIIRTNGWSKEALPILGLTADFRTADLIRYQSIGMNDCVGKPIRMNDLNAHICKAMAAAAGGRIAAAASVLSPSKTTTTTPASNTSTLPSSASCQCPRIAQTV